MAFENRTIQRLAAVIFSLLINIGFYVIAWATQRPGKDDGLLMVTAFALSIIGSSLIMGRRRLEPRESFLRLYLASCLAGLLPCLLFVLFASIKYSYSVGSILFGTFLFGILMTVSAAVALPFVAMFYFKRERHLSIHQDPPVDLG
jgi:general stress protein CsbA